MQLTNAYQLPYLDPNGYDMLAASDLEVLARRVDTIVSGFDARTAGLLTKPTLIKEANSNSVAQPAWVNVDPVFDLTRFDNSGGGLTLQGGNDFAVNPAKLNPNCYVLMHFTGGVYASGSVSATAWYRGILAVLDSSRGIGYEEIANYYQTAYWTTDTPGHLNIMALIRLRPSQIVRTRLYHNNTSNAYCGWGSTTASMTYLMEAD